MAQSSIIFGINVAEGLGELTSFDTALKNLGLDPENLSALGNIVSTTDGITRDHFYTLSRLKSNIFDIGNTLSGGVTDSVFEVEKTAGSFRTSTQTFDGATGVKGNVYVNGPIGAPAIRFFSVEEQETDGTLQPLDISTSRVSSWSRSGNRISYGGDLLIDSPSADCIANVRNTPSVGTGSIVVNELGGLTEITPRTFAAEVATHKLKIRINDHEYYMLAMKNIPLRFSGRFRGGSSLMEVDSNTAPSYRVITGNDFEDVLDTKTLNFNAGSTLSRTIEVYTNPAAVITLKANSLLLDGFPRADYDSLETLELSNNEIKTLPNLKSIAPNLDTFKIANNPLNESPAGSDPNVNKITQTLLDRIPQSTSPNHVTGVTVLDISKSFTGKVTGNFRTSFQKLTSLNISGKSGRALSETKLPEIGTQVTTYNGASNRYSSVPGLAPIKTIDDTPTSGLSALDGNNAKFILRRLKDRFEVEVVSGGSGYTNDTLRQTINGNVLAGVTGAGSPEGIPFGNLVVQVSGGEVTAANFSPAGAAHVGALSATGPTLENILVAGRTFSLSEGYDCPYREVGYYTDAGLFSSPTSLRTLTLSSAEAPINNVKHAFMNLSLGADSHPSYNSDFTSLTISSSKGFPVPFMQGLTSLSSFNAQSIQPLPIAQMKTDLNLEYSPSKYDSPTAAEIGRMYTLVDSPLTYKFSGCTALRTLNISNSHVRGKLSNFDGNNTLVTFDATNTVLFDHLSSSTNSPTGLHHNQFANCKTTLETFKFTRKSTTGENIWSDYSSDFSDKHANHTGRVKFSSTLGYTDAPFTKGPTNGRLATDDLINIKTFHWNTGNSTKGPLPTFTDATSLEELDLKNNKFGAEYTYTDDSSNSITISGVDFDEWRVYNSKDSLKRLILSSNELTGSINFQNMANADSTTSNDMSVLDTFEIQNNKLDTISNFGHTSLPKLRFLRARNAFKSDGANDSFVPVISNKLPEIRVLDLSDSSTSGIGPFTSIAGATTTLFAGCTKLTTVNLSGNRFEPPAIINVLRSLKNLGKRNVTVDFSNQKDANGDDGNTDIRLASTHTNYEPSVSDNDLIQKDLKNINVTVLGITSELIPDAPRGPTLNVTFNNLDSTRDLREEAQAGINIGTLDGSTFSGNISVTLTITGSLSGFEEVILEKRKSNGTTVEIKRGEPSEFTATIADTITLSGNDPDINTNPSVFPIDSGLSQTVTYITKASNPRGFGPPTQQGLPFINITQ